MSKLKHIAIFLFIVAISFISFNHQASAVTAKVINQRVNNELSYFTKNIGGGANLLKHAKGALVLPKVYNAGFGIGGKYGEGALRVGGKTVAYYNLIAATYGFQIGAQKQTIIILFMDDKSLSEFRNSQNWEVGADATVTVIDVDAARSIDTNTIKDPVIGFVVNQKGLMAGVSLKGLKISKIQR